MRTSKKNTQRGIILDEEALLNCETKQINKAVRVGGGIEKNDWRMTN